MPCAICYTIGHNKRTCLKKKLIILKKVIKKIIK